MSTIKAFFKDTLIYGIAAVLPRVINLVLVAVFTAILGKADFSDQTTWYVYAAFINVVLTMGVETAFFRFYTAEKDKTGVLSSSLFILCLSSFLFLSLGLLFVQKISFLLGFNDPVLLKILIWTTVLDTLTVIPFAFLRVSGRPVKFMVLKLANVVLLFIITILLLYVLPGENRSNLSFLTHLGINLNYTPGVVHIVAANFIASLFTLLCVVPELLKIRWRVDSILIYKMLNYGWPIMVGGLAYVINENMDKLLIQKLINKEANGVYAACYKLGVFMTLYITAFRMGAEPYFFNHSKTENARQKYSFIMTWFVIFGCLFIVFVTGFIDFFAGIIIRNNIYLEGLFIAPVILLANLFSGIYNNLSIWYKLTDRTKFGMYLSIFGAGLTIVSLLIFVPWLGIMGGAIATLVTYASMAFISAYLGHKQYPVPYEIGKICMYITVTTILGALSFIHFRGNYLFSVLSILVLICLVYFSERKTFRFNEGDISL